MIPSEPTSSTKVVKPNMEKNENCAINVKQNKQQEQTKLYSDVTKANPKRDRDTEVEENKSTKESQKGTSGGGDGNEIFSIPTVIHGRTSAISEKSDFKADENDFSEYIVKRTKHFFLGGFTQSVTEDLIYKLVSRRGIKVTQIQIFRPRHGKYAVIKLNVEVPNSEKLLDSEFWPEGVTCRPWIPRRRSDRYHQNGANVEQGETHDFGSDRHNDNRQYAERPYWDRSNRREIQQTRNRYRFYNRMPYSADVD